jgi:hypothetical protein
MIIAQSVSRYWIWTVPWLRRLVAGLSPQRPGFDPGGQSMWDLWWTKWHWDRVFSEYFGFLLSISFHRCSITMEKQKKPHHLHHRVPQISLQGCGASVAPAAGPFNKLIIIIIIIIIFTGH